MSVDYSKKWTPERVECLREIARASYSMAEAAQKATSVLGFMVSIDSAENTLRRYGTPARSLLRTKIGGHVTVVAPPAPPPQAAPATPVPSPDPVERRERQDEATRLRREHAELVDRLREANKRADIMGAMRGAYDSPRIPRRETASGIREMTAIALASDWHVEETVDPDTISGRNEYNLAIADRRIARFFDAIVWNVERQRCAEVAIRDLVLWLGGDLLSGYIHEELLESNELSPVETVLWLLPRLRNGIAMLLDRLQLETLTVPCSYGNHGRVQEKKRISTGAQNSFEWLLYNVLAEEFRTNKRVRFVVTPSVDQYVELYDSFTAHFTHGDTVKSMGGVGGISVPLLRAKPRWDLVRFADWSFLGHFHQLSDFGRVIVNGSLIGYNAYARSIGASYEPPRQGFHLIDSRRGKCLSAPLWVDDSEAKPQQHREAA